MHNGSGNTADSNDYEQLPEPHQIHAMADDDDDDDDDDDKNKYVLTDKFAATFGRLSRPKSAQLCFQLL